MRIIAACIIALSSWVVIEGDAIWEKLWPQQFWQVKVSQLERYERHCLWRLKSIEWQLMKIRAEMSIGVSEAQDKALCLKMDQASCVSLAKERSLLKIKTLLHEEAQAKAAHEETLRLLKLARQRLFSFLDEGRKSPGKIAVEDSL